MKSARSLLASASMLALTGTAFADPQVVTSIKPVHSLVAGVMEGVAEPTVIVEGAASPHSFSLRPSKARDLENADVIVWVGPQLETFLDKPIDTIGNNAMVLELAKAHDITTLPFREGVTFEGHSHGDEHHDDDEHDHAAEGEHDHDHDHKAEAEHDHDDDHDHAAEAEHEHDHDHAHADEKDAHGDEHDHAEHDHDDDDHSQHAEHDDHGDDHHDHAHGEFDLHLWLDPRNAKAFVAEIAEVLSKADPDNSATYEANASRMGERLDQLEADIRQKLEPVGDRGFIVFHDAYQYFENRFGVNAVGSITVSPEVAPGAERVAAIRDKVAELDVTCVFSEPQFSPNLITVVTEQTDAKAAVLDPLGANLDAGPDLYFTLLDNLAQNMRDCLSESS